MAVYLEKGVTTDNPVRVCFADLEDFQTRNAVIMATMASTPTIGAAIAAIGIGCEFEEVRAGGGGVEALKGAVGTLAAFRASEML
jgi:hypothetical protein